VLRHEVGGEAGTERDCSTITACSNLPNSYPQLRGSFPYSPRPGNHRRHRTRRHHLHCCQQYIHIPYHTLSSQHILHSVPVMSDALPDDTWINNFLSSPPRPLQAALQKRLHASTTHLNSLAEIYKQRAAIETQYAESLAKLARSAEQGSLLPKAGIEWDKSSGEGKIWETVVNEISEACGSNQISADVDRPRALIRP